MGNRGPAHSPHGPTSPPSSSHDACSAAVLSGGVRLSLLMAFLWRGGGRGGGVTEVRGQGSGVRWLRATYTGEPAGQMSCRQRPMWPMTWSTSSTEPSRRLQPGPRSYSSTSCKGAAESSREQQRAAGQAAVKGPVHRKHTVLGLHRCVCSYLSGLVAADPLEVQVAEGVLHLLTHTHTHTESLY